jgi:hypothetical protein
MNYLQMIFIAALSLIPSLTNSPAQKQQVKSIALKLRDALTMVYEPEQHQGSVNAKTDAAHFATTAIDNHIAGLNAGQNQPETNPSGTEEEVLDPKLKKKEVK